MSTFFIYVSVALTVFYLGALVILAWAALYKTVEQRKVTFQHLWKFYAALTISFGCILIVFFQVILSVLANR